ncbi:hypothetical protein AB0D11_45695 [Streptomyces monashensis]|uniref:hypothetical protein n=1 Tax=Streptomyces monashensis TaxID=1678012 RepID=UPI0033ECA191
MPQKVVGSPFTPSHDAVEFHLRLEKGAAQVGSIGYRSSEPGECNGSDGDGNDATHTNSRVEV